MLWPAYSFSVGLFNLIQKRSDPPNIHPCRKKFFSNGQIELKFHWGHYMFFFRFELVFYLMLHLCLQIYLVIFKFPWRAIKDANDLHGRELTSKYDGGSRSGEVFYPFWSHSWQFLNSFKRLRKVIFYPFWAQFDICGIDWKWTNLFSEHGSYF